MDEILADLREAELQLRRKADGVAGVTEHADALARLAEVVKVRSRLVLMGEVNAGKTSLANVLLGEPLLPAGVLANTRRPVQLRDSEVTSVTGFGSEGPIKLNDETDLHSDLRLERIEVTLPCPRLKTFDLVDTPGNSTFAKLDKLRLRTSDVLVWCTPATQAWKESERQLWMSVPKRFYRNAILVATHRDCLHDKEDIRRVSTRLDREAGSFFRSVVLIASGERTDKQLRTGDGLDELDEKIAESLAAIAHRRAGAAYEIADHVIRRAMTLAAAGGTGPAPRWVLSTFGRPPEPKPKAKAKAPAAKSSRKPRGLTSGWRRKKEA